MPTIYLTSLIGILLLLGCDSAASSDSSENIETILRVQSTADSMHIVHSSQSGWITSNRLSTTFTFNYNSPPDSLIFLYGTFYCTSQLIPCNARMEILIDNEVVRSRELKEFREGVDVNGDAILHVNEQEMGIYHNYNGESYFVQYRMHVEKTEYYGSTSIQEGTGALLQLEYDAPRNSSHSVNQRYSVEPGFSALMIEHQSGRRGGEGPYLACSKGGIYTELGPLVLPMYAAEICGSSPQIFTILGIVEE